jgi:hypothetical protein
MLPVIPQAILNFQNYKKRSKARRKLLLNLIASGEINIDDEEAIEDDDYSDEKEPVKRKRYEREHYMESCWWKFLQRDNLSDLSSRDGKTFRNRFTVPYQLYTHLLSMAKNWFPQNVVDSFGYEVTPISLKLLGTLRILGKGCSWDLLYELSGVSAEVHRRWTLAFLAKFA